MLSFILRFLAWTIPRISICFLALSLVVASNLVQAGSATWNQNPADDNWYNSQNWTPATVPNGPDDVATFSNTQVTNVALPAGSSTVLDSLIFGPAASELFIDISDQASLTFTRGGLIDNAPSFVGVSVLAGGALLFQGSSVAEAYIPNFGTLEFRDNSITSGGIVCYGSEIPAEPGSLTTFFDHSVAQDVIVLNDGFLNGHPSQLYFTDYATADEAQFVLSGRSVLDISSRRPPGLTINSFGGHGGVIYLGANNLTVTNEYGGAYRPEASIQDGGVSGGTGGTLTKVGGAEDVLSLFGPSTYSGGTFINGGVLYAETGHGSATGTGPVWVNRGSLGGGGYIIGPVKVGTGTGMPAVLTPGHNEIRPFTRIGTLTIRRRLTFVSDGILQSIIDTLNAVAANVTAGGVTIDAGAKIQFLGLHQQPVSLGTIFTIIDNTAATPITGTFTNLPDGGTTVIAGNTYQANYEGGDGNDLTLTVVQ